MTPEIGYQLELFRKAITDLIGHNYVQYTRAGQEIQNNPKTPWVQLELIRTIIENTTEGYDEQGNELIPCTEIKHSLLINVHSRFRESNNHETFASSLKLQAIFFNPNFNTQFKSYGIAVRAPTEETEGFSAIEFDQVQIDQRIEPDDHFPIVLELSNLETIPGLTTGWFEKILQSTDIKNISDSSLNLDNEEIGKEPT